MTVTKILIAGKISPPFRRRALEIINNNIEIPFDAAETGKGHSDFFQNIKEAKSTLLLTQRTSRKDYVSVFSPGKSLKGTMCRSFVKFVPLLNCAYACDFCYLYKTNRNVPLMTQYVDYENMAKTLEEFISAPDKFGAKISRFRPPFIFNTGELGDSLSFDNITGWTRFFVPYFGSSLKEYSDKLERPAYLLLGTKGDNIENLLDMKDCHNKRTIVFFSINAQTITRNVTHTPSPERVVAAAKKLEEAGYPVEFRFDPLFSDEHLYNGKSWKQEYAEMIELVVSQTNPIQITLGTYRPGSGLEYWISQYAPGSPLLEIKGTKQGGKYRADETARHEVMDYVLEETIKMAKKAGKKIPVSYCKETVLFWKGSPLAKNGRIPKLTCNCCPDIRENY